MEIIQISVTQIQQDPNGAALFEAYSKESRNKDLPKHNPNWDLYHHMENSGMMRVFGAYADHSLVGFIVILLAPMPHYSHQIATVESFYVDPEYRSYGAGKRILKVAEDYAREMGSPVLYVTAPTGGRLDLAMPTLGYRPTNTIYCRKLNG